MKKILIYFALLLIGCHSTPKYRTIKNLEKKGQLLFVKSDSESKFNYPYYLYLPDGLDFFRKRTLVLTNNTGASDNFYKTIQKTKDQILKWTDLSEKLSSPLLVPVFPRSKTHWKNYTHALDRDTLSIKGGELSRIDLQLIEMVNSARKIVFSETGHRLNKKIDLFGFSASAMFANRFTFIHPKLVHTLVFGSPGGWPIAPIKMYKNKKLRYPIGVSDLKYLIGKSFDIESLKEVRIFAFLGDLDSNDSVIYRDGYDKEDENLIFPLFGKNPTLRWPLSQKIYASKGLKSTFKLYKGVGHGTNGRIHKDIVGFFQGKNID